MNLLTRSHCRLIIILDTFIANYHPEYNERLKNTKEGFFYPYTDEELRERSAALNSWTVSTVSHRQSAGADLIKDADDLIESRLYTIPIR